MVEDRAAHGGRFLEHQHVARIGHLDDGHGGGPCEGVQQRLRSPAGCHPVDASQDQGHGTRDRRRCRQGTFVGRGGLQVQGQDTGWAALEQGLRAAEHPEARCGVVAGVLWATVAPRGDQFCGPDLVGIGGPLQVGVYGHEGRHSHEHGRGDLPGVVGGGLEGDQSTEGVADQTDPPTEGVGESGRPGCRLGDGAECRALGSAVAGQVDRNGPVAMMGQEPGLVRPHRTVHAGPVDEDHEWLGRPGVHRHGTGGGVDDTTVDGEPHCRCSAL